MEYSASLYDSSSYFGSKFKAVSAFGTEDIITIIVRNKAKEKKKTTLRSEHRSEYCLVNESENIDISQND